MPLYRGSRFRKAPIGYIQLSDESKVKVYGVTTTTLDAPARSQKYRVKAGETFETIAHREYGDGNKWYVLAMVNSQIFWPLDLEANDEIIVPPRSFAELL
jgi:nucleoid-associated protein YgaU